MLGESRPFYWNLFYCFTLMQGQGEKRREEKGRKRIKTKKGDPVLYVLFGLCLGQFYVAVRCLRTVEGGFIHTQIISGVSLPLRLVETVTGYNKQICWPRAQTSRRQAQSPPQSQAQTKSWPAYAVPNTHIMCLRTPHWGTYTLMSAFPTVTNQKYMLFHAFSSEALVRWGIAILF